MNRALTLVVLLGVTWAFQGLTLRIQGESWTGDLSFLLGFLFLASFLAGKISERAHLPRITGYLLLGWIVGPDLLGILKSFHLTGFRVVEDIAISLIAFAAGGELSVGALRRNWRQIAGILSLEMTAVFTTIFLAVLVCAPRLPLTQGLDSSGVLTVAMIFGSIAVANSPAVAIAILKETRAQGPVSSIVLAVTVAKDVMVVILFAGALAVARALAGSGAAAHGVGWILGWEVVGSLAAGLAVGWVLTLYLHRSRSHSVLLVLGAAMGISLIAGFLRLEALLMSLSAGFFVRTVGGGHAPSFLRAVESNSVPFYCLFFSLAGAGIRLPGIRDVGPFVLLFTLLRATAILVSTRLGARLTGAPETVRRYGWTGFLSQAGVALGMVTLAARAFPEWGTGLQTMLVAMVALHELLGPVFFHQGLRRAGEIREPVETQAWVEEGGAEPHASLPRDYSGLGSNPSPGPR